MLDALFTNSFVPLISEYVFGIVFLGASAVYFFGAPSVWRRYFLWLIYGVAGFRVLYAAFITAGQYYIWSQDEFTRLFLSSSNGGLAGYFLPYTGFRFWLGSVVFTFVLAGSFALLLRYLRQRKESYFEEGEVELGVLMMLLVGWPEGILFLSLLAFTVVFVSVFRLFVWRNPYTTLGTPFVIAAALTLLRGERLIELLGWGVLRV
jgi:hypothetical protein